MHHFTIVFQFHCDSIIILPIGQKILVSSIERESTIASLTRNGFSNQRTQEEFAVLSVERFLLYELASKLFS